MVLPLFDFSIGITPRPLILTLGGKRKEESKMRKFGFLVAMIVVIGLALVSESFAQKGIMWKGSGGWGMGTPYGKMYNPKTVG